MRKALLTPVTPLAAACFLTLSSAGALAGGPYGAYPSGPHGMPYGPMGPRGGYGAMPAPRMGYGAPHAMPYGGMPQRGPGVPPRSMQPRDQAPAQAAARPSAGTGGDGASAGDEVVRIGGMRFEPSVLRVEAGETVTWRQQDRMPHTVTGRGDQGPRSGRLGAGGSFSHTFTEPGTYEYYCSLHPSMTGTVVVE